jgi:hypothetical protein
MGIVENDCIPRAETGLSEEGCAREPFSAPDDRQAWLGNAV